MLEDGEISNSSIEFSSLENTSSIAENDSLNSNSIGTSPNSSSKSSKPNQLVKLVNQNAVEQSLIELFSMDLKEDQLTSKPKERKVFTMWSKQLIEEKMQAIKDENAAKQMNSKQIKEHRKTKKEQKKEHKNLVDFASDIAHSLKEKRTDIVLKIVESIGFDRSSELCVEAQQVFATTGMLTVDGRKRSLGGCFFQLVKVKGNLNDAIKREIFYEPVPKKRKQIKNAKKRMKKQLQEPKPDSQNSLVDILKNMNINMNVRFN